MIPLIITYARHAVHRCCKGNATGLDHLSYDNEWLIGDVCLSSECWSFEECDLCNIQDIEVVIDWFSAVVWVAIKMSHSLVALVNSHVLRKLLIRTCVVPGHFSINRF